MYDTLRSIGIGLGVGVLFSLPGIALGYWLKRTNAAPNRSGLSLIFCIVLVIIRQIWLPELSLGWLALITIVGSTLGVYRMDIYWSIKQTNPMNDEEEINK